jgi:hypothetical protein
MTDTKTKRMSREELIKRLSKYHFHAANSDASFEVLIAPSVPAEMKEAAN